MKKLILVIAAIAMVAAFAPAVQAGETAQLGLSVTFAVDQDLQRVEEIRKNVDVMLEKNDAKFREIYADRNGDGVVDYQDLDLNGDGRIDDFDIQILHEAVSYLDMLRASVETNIDELKSILSRRPDLEHQIIPVVEYANKVAGTIVENIHKLKGLDVESVIAIELEGPNPWVLDNVKLGERRSNVSTAEGILIRPLHTIHNTGNVPIGVGIRYAEVLSTPESPKPGLEQGYNTFVTLLRDFAIPPDGERPVVKGLAPRDEAPVVLTYGAPTGVSDKTQGMKTAYELRAYKTIVIDDPIVKE